MIQQRPLLSRKVETLIVNFINWHSAFLIESVQMWNESGLVCKKNTPFLLTVTSLFLCRFATVSLKTDGLKLEDLGKSTVGGLTVIVPFWRPLHQTHYTHNYRPVNHIYFVYYNSITHITYISSNGSVVRISDCGTRSSRIEPALQTAICFDDDCGA